MEEQLPTQKNLSSEMTVFEKHIKPALRYIGLIGASIMAVLYVVIVVVLITGFEEHVLTDDIIFALVTSAVGFIIMQFLKYQGTTFAKEQTVNKEILKEYYEYRAKKKKVHSIRYYWIVSVIADMISKVFTIVVTTTGIIYIIIQGMHDYTLILLALVNLLMFVCFGMVSLSNAYDFFNTNHMPYIKEQLKQYKKELGENEHRLQRSKQTTTRSTNTGRVQQKKKSRARHTNRTTKN